MSMPHGYPVSAVPWSFAGRNEDPGDGSRIESVSPVYESGREDYIYGMNHDTYHPGRSGAEKKEVTLPGSRRHESSEKVS